MKKNKTTIEENLKVLQEGITPTIIFVSGFLTEEEESNTWIKSVKGIFPKNTIIHLKWESENLKKIRDDFLVKTIKYLPLSILMPASSLFLEKPISYLESVYNSWNKANIEANEIGKELANHFITKKYNELILIGHSLGTKVICACLDELKEKKYNCVNEVHLLAGAINKDEIDFMRIEGLINNKIYNYYTNEDLVLKFLYKISNLFDLNFQSLPIGLKAICEDTPKNIYISRKIKDIDVSSYTSWYTATHSSYYKFLDEIIKSPTNLHTTE